jgi:hypothetical protein
VSVYTHYDIMPRPKHLPGDTRHPRFFTNVQEFKILGVPMPNIPPGLFFSVQLPMCTQKGKDIVGYYAMDFAPQGFLAGLPGMSCSATVDTRLGTQETMITFNSEAPDVTEIELTRRGQYAAYDTTYVYRRHVIEAMKFGFLLIAPVGRQVFGMLYDGPLDSFPRELVLLVMEYLRAPAEANVHFYGAASRARDPLWGLFHLSDGSVPIDPKGDPECKQIAPCNEPNSKRMRLS